MSVFFNYYYYYYFALECSVFTMACSAILSSYVAGIAPRVGLGRPALVPRKHALRVRCAGDQVSRFCIVE